MARGLGAGLIGTGVMTAVQTAVMKAQGSESSDTPAQVGKRISEGVFKQPVSREKMGTLNNARHFGYGTSWGALYGLTQGPLHPRSSTIHGLLFGTLVCGASLLELPAMKLAPPCGSTRRRTWRWTSATTSPTGSGWPRGTASSTADRKARPGGPAA